MTQISGLLRILRKWIRPHDTGNCPTLQLPPAIPDDEVEFWGDLLYLRGLLESIVDGCNPETRLSPIPSDISTALDAALILVAHDFADGPEA